MKKHVEEGRCFSESMKEALGSDANRNEICRSVKTKTTRERSDEGCSQSNLNNRITVSSLPGMAKT